MKAEDGTPLKAAANLLLEQELLSIVGQLDRAELPHVVLKGTPLLRRLGLPLSSRQLHDNDILVRPEDAVRAVEVLRALGYRPAKATIPLDSRHTFQFLLARRHETGVAVALDLHLRLLSPELFPAPGFDPWAHTESQLVGDTALRVPDRELTLIHTAAHLVQHAFAEPRIVHVLGAAWDAWHASVDHAALVRLAHVTGTFPTLVYALNSAHALGSTSAPVGLTSARASALARVLPPERLRDPRPYPDYARMALAWLVLPYGSAPRQLRRALFPRPSELRGIVGPGVSLPWAYLERPLRPFMRRLGVEPRGARHRAP